MEYILFSLTLHIAEHHYHSVTQLYFHILTQSIDIIQNYILQCVLWY